MLSSMFTKERKQILLDRTVKFLLDTVLTQIFAYFVIFSLCGSIPHISELYSTDLLFKYTFFFSLVWNILLSSTAISILTITALFASSIGAVVYYAADPAFHTWINGYFQWISTLFWKYSAVNETFSYVTVIAVTVFFTLLMTFFATRFSNVGMVLFILIPFSVYYELAGDSLGTGYFPTLIFGLALYYMRLRQSVYLDYRLSERYSVRFGRMTNVVMLPAVLIAFLLTRLVAALPEDRYADSKTNLSLSARLVELALRTEENFFSTTRDIVYESDPIGVDDNEGILLNSSRTHTLSVTSYSPATEYFYLRSYAYRRFDGAWKHGYRNGITMPDGSAPTQLAMDEADAAVRLLTSRALNTYESSKLSTERILRRLTGKADISITYEDIRADAFFEVPMAKSYSLLGKSKLTILDDRNGTGLYAAEGVPSGTTYTASHITLKKTPDTAAFYRYFGRGFYDTISEKEESSIYGGNLERWQRYAENTARTYGDCSSASDRLVSLAGRLYDPDKTDYDNALTVAAYLLKHCRYDARVHIAPDGSVDVDQFLFSSHRGNAVHFATTAVLLLRAMGIPARYAEGYLVAAGGSLGEVEVRQKNEHAWAEIYLEGLGWVTLETVPGKGEPATAVLNADYGAEEETVTDSVWRELTLGEIGRAALVLVTKALSFVWRVMSTLLAAAFAVVLLLWGRNFAARRLAMADRSESRLEKMLRPLFSAAAVAGIRRGKGEGLREYAERIDAHLPARYHLAPAVDAAYAVSYGGEKPSAAAEKRLRQTLGEYGRFLSALEKGFRLQILGRLL